MLTRVENTGAFLSIGDKLSGNVRFILLILFPVIAMMVGLYYLFNFTTHVRQSTRLALTFIIGGGLGNIYDRYVYGSVTDFMHLDFILFQTGIFNMADVSIMIGIFVILLGGFINRGHAMEIDERSA